MKPYAILIPGFDRNIYRLTPPVEYWYYGKIPPPEEWFGDTQGGKLGHYKGLIQSEYRRLAKLRYATIYTGRWLRTLHYVRVSEKLPGLVVGRGSQAEDFDVSTSNAKKALAEIGYALLPEDSVYKFWLKEQTVFSPYQNLTTGERKIKEEI